MPKLYGRSYRLEVGSIKIESISTNAGILGPESLRVRFSIEREKSFDPNKAEIVVYNLTKDHQRELGKSDVTVRLSAGYGSSLDLLFFGVLRGSSTERDGNDWATSLTAGDGDNKILTSKVSKSFAKGTLVSDVVSQLAKAIGVEKGNLAAFSAQYQLGGRTLTRPISLRGNAAQVMSDFCRSMGFEFCVIDNQIQLRPEGMPAGEGPLISPETGLIGSPQKQPKGKVAFQCKLMRNVLPGMAVILKSNATSGVCLVEKTRHYGDSHEAEYQIDAEGVLK